MRGIKEVSGADTLPTSANIKTSSTNSNLAAASEEIITFYSNRNLKDGANFSFKNPKVVLKYTQSEPAGNNTPKSQAPQNAKKSILDLARENTEKLRQEQLEKELAQKEAELASLKERVKNKLKSSRKKRQEVA